MKRARIEQVEVRNASAPATRWGVVGAVVVGGSGDDRLSRYCTIMGPAGLTAVFGMGTGGAPQVSSPECPHQAVRPGENGLARDQSGLWCHTLEAGDQILEQASEIKDCLRRRLARGSRTEPIRVDAGGVVITWSDEMRLGLRHSDQLGLKLPSGGGGSGWSSVLAVRTGRLRRSPVVHFRPIDLVVFQEPSSQLRMETSS